MRAIDADAMIDRLERVIQNGVPSENGMHPISAETVLEVVNELSELGTNLAEVGADCISRQRVIEALGELATFTEDWSCHTWMYTDDVCNAIKQLPPIQPKRGKWHYSDGKPARIGLSFGVVCDQCGTESEYCTNFCGECGADMRGEQDG